MLLPHRLHSGQSRSELSCCIRLAMTLYWSLARKQPLCPRLSTKDERCINGYAGDCGPCGEFLTAISNSDASTRTAFYQPLLGAGAIGRFNVTGKSGTAAIEAPPPHLKRIERLLPPLLPPTSYPGFEIDRLGLAYANVFLDCRVADEESLR
jgi:hypothetical protein